MNATRKQPLGKQFGNDRTSRAVKAPVRIFDERHLKSESTNSNHSRESPLSPVWMASALQKKNALIARLVITVLCPATDRDLLVLPLALMGSVTLVPIGNAKLKVQGKARVPRVQDDRTCHHGIRLAIRGCSAPSALRLGGSMFPW